MGVPLGTPVGARDAVDVGDGVPGFLEFFGFLVALALLLALFFGCLVAFVVALLSVLPGPID